MRLHRELAAFGVVVSALGAGVTSPAGARQPATAPPPFKGVWEPGSCLAGKAHRSRCGDVCRG